jgi:hypothetical protein
VMRPQDRVAVKPHAAPVFHALQYLMGHQSRDKLERFRALGGAQAYPSRSKDGEHLVDFSTGSVGLGVGMTLFASLAQDYVRLHGLAPEGIEPGRMIALAGDAELDEGNIFWSAGASSPSNTAASSRRPSRGRMARICANGSTPARTRSTRRSSIRAAKGGGSTCCATSTAIRASARSSTSMTTTRCTR